MTTTTTEQQQDTPDQPERFPTSTLITHHGTVVTLTHQVLVPLSLADIGTLLAVLDENLPQTDDEVALGLRLEAAEDQLQKVVDGE